MRFFTFFFLFLFASATWSADYQIEFQQPTGDTYQLTFTLFNYQIKIVDADGSVYSDIDFSSSVKLNKKGYAALPFVHATIQLPDLKNVDFKIESVETEEIHLRYPMLPSRGVIYRNQNPDTIAYWIDPASITDAWYPGEVAQKTRPFILKDVRGTTVYFYPFQYNAANQTLQICKSIKVTLVENDTNPINPLIRLPGYKILPEMDGIYQSTFLNYDRASQDLDYGQHGDILVISTDRDTAAIAPYINWKREKGFKVSLEVVPKGTNVKSLIQQKYDENNNLLYVLLVGDYDDIQSDKGTSENGPMDPQLGCVVGDDYYADISVGRLSANSANEVTIQVNKIIDYEKNPQAGLDWYKSALGIGSAEGSGSGDDGEVDKDHIQNIWDNKLDPFTYDIYSTAYDPGATDAMVTNAVNDGVSIINYCGHGSMTSWGTTGFNNDDVSNLTNGSKLPFIFSVACVNGAFDDGDCFAEAWLRKENGGAVMFLGSTINQPWAPPMRGQDYFNDILIGGYNYDEHPGQNGINTHEQRTFIGSIVINGFALMLNESNTSSDVETIQTWCIFGDPAMQVRTQAPDALSLSNETIEAQTAFTTTVTSNGSPVNGAMVCISQDGQYFSGLTDVNGQVTIEHTFQDGQALLVVTAFNKETVYKTVDVTGGDGPKVVVDSWAVNHMTDGVENEVEYKEEFYLDVNAKNVGNQPAVNVVGLLSSSDSYVQIIDDQHTYGTIDTAQVVNGPQAFFLKALDGTPDQHALVCTVTFSDTSSSQWQSDITITVNAPDLQDDGLTIDDAAQGDGDGVLDADETANFNIPLFNQGHAASEAGKATLTTNSPYLTIQTDSVAVPILYVQDTLLCSYSVVASADAPQGEVADLYFSATCGAYTLLDTFRIYIGGKAIYLMQNGTFEVTDGYFYDSGGKDGNYSTDENYTMTFLPADRAAVKVVFHSFSTIANYDKLYIYDGPDDTYPQVPGSPFSGDNSPGEIEATNSAGALTFHFVSNPVLGGTGWEADIFTTGISEVQERTTATIRSFKLLSNYPNPFNPETHIRYQLPTTARVQVNIFNLLGQKVRTLFDGTQNQGLHQLRWDGRDQAGHALSSGIYIVQVKAGKQIARQKLLLVK